MKSVGVRRVLRVSPMEEQQGAETSRHGPNNVRSPGGPFAASRFASAGSSGLVWTDGPSWVPCPSRRDIFRSQSSNGSNYRTPICHSRSGIAGVPAFKQYSR
jgi:hypothetical protein